MSCEDGMVDIYLSTVEDLYDYAFSFAAGIPPEEFTRQLGERIARDTTGIGA